MSRTSELVKLPGIVAAALFSRKGFLEGFEGALTEVETEKMAALSAAITINLEMQGRLLGRMVDQSGWDSSYGWVMWGPEMSFVAIHDNVCIVRGEQTSFNQVIEAMKASADAEIITPWKGEPNADIG